MAHLLVSVRSVCEAEAALAGGAALIDVKEPAAGSLGRAGAETVAAIIRHVAGRRPVSAALGEWLETSTPFGEAGLAYVKWGLAGCGRRPGWPRELALADVRLRQASPACRLVAVAYADWRRADAPPPEEVCRFACEQPSGAFLLDTWRKDGTTLLDWLPLDEIHQLRSRCRTAGVPVALAGSLGPEQMNRLRSVEPDWFAVRGAVCHGGRRGQAIDPTAVRGLADLLADASRPVAEVHDLHP